MAKGQLHKYLPKSDILPEHFKLVMIPSQNYNQTNKQINTT